MWRCNYVEALPPHASPCRYAWQIHALTDVFAWLHVMQTERRLRDRKRGKVKSAAFSWINKHEIFLV